MDTSKKRSLRKPHNHLPGYVFERKHCDGHIVVLVAEEASIVAKNKYVAVYYVDEFSYIGPSFVSLPKAREWVKGTLKEQSVAAFSGIHDMATDTYVCPYRGNAGYVKSEKYRDGHAVIYNANKAGIDSSGRFVIVWERGGDASKPSMISPGFANSREAQRAMNDITKHEYEDRLGFGVFKRRIFVETQSSMSVDWSVTVIPTEKGCLYEFFRAADFANILNPSKEFEIALVHELPWAMEKEVLEMFIKVYETAKQEGKAAFYTKAQEAHEKAVRILQEALDD